MGSTKPVLKIRTDGGPDIGLGHVVRCISLAYMLKNDFTIHFFSLEIPNSLKKEIIRNGWNVTVIEKESDFLNALTGDEIVVLDGYRFDSGYQKGIKEKGCKLVCIDDFHNQHFYADLVINHAPGVDKEEYKGEPYTKYLLGTDYALLRPEFLETKSIVKKDSSGSIKNVFICFGGSDVKNLTAKVVSLLPSDGFRATVVLGDAYNHYDELNKVIDEREDLEIVIKNSLSAKEMRQVLEQADVAVVPASGISLEALAVGVPTIIGHYASNQIGMYNGLVNKKGFYNAFDFSKEKFVEAFETVSNNYRRSEKINPSDIPKRLNSEFVKLRSQLELNLRKASVGDIDDLFEWANDPITRRNSYNQEKIDYTSHVKWAQNRLNSSDCLFLIFENSKAQKIGFVRFDKNEQKNWVISINIAPVQRGNGYSVELLRRAISHFVNIKDEAEVEAYIKRENIASVKAFERAGFEVLKNVNVKGEESVLMIWK